MPGLIAGLAQGKSDLRQLARLGDALLQFIQTADIAGNGRASKAVIVHHHLQLIGVQRSDGIGRISREGQLAQQIQLLELLADYVLQGDQLLQLFNRRQFFRHSRG